MKFTFSWLKEHLETNAQLEEIIYALTDLGLEVEEVINPLEQLKEFTIGRIIKTEKHQDADKLRVCQVETADGVAQIICGAPNARNGINVVVAKPGTYVPGIDTTIGIGKIRGVESYGMMCSEREMGLSDEHEGIIELADAKIGESFGDWLTANKPSKTDAVIELAITPNRPDALGVRGIARDLAARNLGKLKPQANVSVNGKFACPISVSIDEDTLAQCPVFYGRIIRGVKNCTSPQWLRDKLIAVGLRPISALVDITNFFTLDNNRPLHVFDASKIEGDSLRVHVAKGGEKFIALDEKEHFLESGMTVISDSNGIKSLAGIIGGLDTACNDETKDVFLEAAFFDPITTSYTGRALKINSDARYRFERGIDPDWTAQGIESATRMILEICGGEASNIVVAGALPSEKRSYKLDINRIEALVGLRVSPENQIDILRELGFVVSKNMALVPSWRPDVRGEADLVEEVARVASLTKLVGKPLKKLSDGVTQSILSESQKKEQISRRSMAGLGYNECINYSFIDKRSAELFGGQDKVRLENPISTEMSHMRSDLLPGLLQAIAKNQARGFLNLAFFEVGTIFSGGEPGQEELAVSALLIGRTDKKNVHDDTRKFDIFDAKADAEFLLKSIGAPKNMKISRAGPAWWHPGRHGCFCLGPQNIIGVFGEIHPKILREFDVKGPAVGFTVWLENVPVPRKKKATRPALEINDLQSVERDFAFVVDERVDAATLVNAVATCDKEFIESVEVFDEFKSDQLSAGKKSIAIAVRLQPKDKTLNEITIKSISAKIVTAVKKTTGGDLRD